MHVLAFDTANEVIALGLGRLLPGERRIELTAEAKVAAHRASNTQLLPRIDELLHDAGVERADIACVCVGRGPGSFTGVRIALATAKGIASALEVPLVGISTLDAVAWGAWAADVRGRLLVVADAMRKEVYPAWFELDAGGAARLTPDRVVKADAFANEIDSDSKEGVELSRPAVLARQECPLDIPARCGTRLVSTTPSFSSTGAQLTGDALGKHSGLFGDAGTVLPEDLWTPTGRGLLLALQAAWREGEADPLDEVRHDPGKLLPVYTRLSDAEENERKRLASDEPKNLRTGVQDSRATMHATSQVGAFADADGIVYAPLDSAHAEDVARLEAQVMGTDAWSAAMVLDELPRADRTWWRATDASGATLGYAGGMVVDGDVQILKVATDPAHRCSGIARQLVERVCEDARNLGATTASLEVRASNEGAIAFYEALGFASIGTRPRYYSDGEDALIMGKRIDESTANERIPKAAALRDNASDHREGDAFAGARANAPSSEDDVPGGRDCSRPYEDRRSIAHPLILAIESSCDETAASIIDGSEQILSDVVASQVDFHARFGGVVPEIASRKHIEAICGVCDQALEDAGTLRYADLDAIAVTYAPGLVGALVVGVAFAKGAAWGANIPFIGVNHLEGHLYANKLAEGFEPPAVVSLISGGNTMLVHMRDWGDYEVLGATIDDAVGEAFDKVAKALGLPYPGGPHISRLAAEGDPAAIDFPRAMLHSGDLRFSLSGLKTAVTQYINAQREAGEELNLPDICASFQAAVVDVQVAKARTALRQTHAPTLCIGGGVAANPELRHAYERMCAEEGVRLIMPPLSACGDNAAMIALVALDRFNSGSFFALDADAQAHADLSEPY